MWKYKLYEKLNGEYLNENQSPYLDIYVDIESEAALGILANSMKPDELEKFFVTADKRPGEIFPLSKWLYISNASEIE